MRARPDGRDRPGFALTLVLLFVMLLLSVVGLTFRQVASALRLETARSRQIVRDEGSMQAVAQGLTLLQNGPPPTDPYAFTAGIATSAGPRRYTVTIASEGTDLWSVNAVLNP